MTRRRRSTLPGGLAECRDCGQPIRFIHLDTGNRIPVNPKPGHTGTVAARKQGNELVGFVISKDHRPGPLDPYRFVPHPATCPERDRKPSTPPTAPDPALF